ncbi:MAG: spermidine/putrescine ABC transporter substrate-binding protein [Actinobacteria bacterium]|nr:spermidine/putrescine ABC transporter substrate-binding protein [Actinomycetota bacterium]
MGTDDGRQERQEPVSRRRFLTRAVLAGAAGLSIPAALWASRPDGGSRAQTSATGERTSPSDAQPSPSAEPSASGVSGFAWEEQEITGSFTFANWPYYIDRTQGNGHPSLDRFSGSTSIDVAYRRPIRGNARFLEKIRPALEAGDPIGYDLIVMTNGPELSTMMREGWLLPLPAERLPTFDLHAAQFVRDPPWDPGNGFTAAWQSGLTGLAYRPEAVAALGRTPRSVQDLWDPALKGHVGMMEDLQDLGGVALLSMGVDPPSSTPADWEGASARLRDQQDAGIVRGYYDQAYVGALKRGDVWLCQAWSGDIFQLNATGSPELRFVVPDEGALLWTDNMAIPANAEHPLDALTYMDFVYQPRIAALIADWVGYISPVPEAAQVVRDRLHDPAVARSPLVFPRDRALGPGEGFTSYYAFKSALEEQEWDRLFAPIATPDSTTASS